MSKPSRPARNLEPFPGILNSGPKDVVSARLLWQCFASEIYNSA